MAASLTAASANAPPVDARGDSGAASQPTATAPAADAGAYGLRTTEALTGDWGGARTWLADRGIEFGLFLTSVYQHNAHGGVRTHNGHDVTGSADYELTLDLNRMQLVPGAVVYAHAESSWNDGISESRVGDGFGVNGDAGGDEDIALYECWYEQQFLDGRLRVRVGKIDLTVDFDTNAYANDETLQFLNGALINTANVPWPDYGLGAQAILTPFDGLYVGLGAADAQAVGTHTGFDTAFHGGDYFFGVLELGLMPEWQTRRGRLPGAFRVGAWYDPQPKAKFFNDLQGRRRTVPLGRDDMGFYLSADQLLFKEKPDDAADAQGLGVFVRYGYAPEDVNPVEHVWSVGGQYQGLVPTRDDDVLGFGFAEGIAGDAFRRFEGGGRESVYELYYSIRLMPWLTVTPDLQYVQNPGGGETPDAIVVGVRVQASF